MRCAAGFPSCPGSSTGSTGYGWRLKWAGSGPRGNAARCQAHRRSTHWSGGSRTTLCSGEEPSRPGGTATRQYLCGYVLHSGSKRHDQIRVADHSRQAEARTLAETLPRRPWRMPANVPSRQVRAGSSRDAAMTSEPSAGTLTKLSLTRRGLSLRSAWKPHRCRQGCSAKAGEAFATLRSARGWR